MTNSEHPLRRALREQEVYKWKPNAPIRFFYGEADTRLDQENPKLAVKYMTGLGATDVSLVNLGKVDHTGSWVKGLHQVRKWFDSFK